MNLLYSPSGNPPLKANHNNDNNKAGKTHHHSLPSDKIQAFVVSIEQSTADNEVVFPLHSVPGIVHECRLDIATFGRGSRSPDR